MAQFTCHARPGDRDACSIRIILLTASLAAGPGDRAAEQALSRLLLDRADRSDTPIPGGVEGAYANPRRVVISQTRPCVFRIFEEGLNENGDRAGDWTIDVAKVTAITVETVDRPSLDPAVARLYRIAAANGKAVHVTFTGSADPRQEVFCHMKLCWGSTLRFLQPASHLDHARKAAADLRTLCPGPAS